ncbi:MAG: HipA domain-containing protein [Verrucomicrobia bacterium]|nr:HipA domain-containing protein [Verrucomicrobiota bacterium]
MSMIFIDADWRGLDGPQRVGVARISTVRGRETLAFAFDPDWLSQYGGLMLDPLLLATTGWHYPSVGGLPGILHDSAPDRWGRVLMRRRETEHARREGRPERSLTDADFLLGVSDATRSGGLRFRTAADGPFLAESTGAEVPPMTSLRKLESVARRIDADGEAAWSDEMELLLAPGSSLGGARPKASVAAPDGSLWVAKFPSSRDEVDVGAWEDLTYHLAGLCGLRTAEARSESYSRHGHTFLIRRFDRDGPVRIHFASAMCLLGSKDGDGAGTGIGYLDLADLILRISASPGEDLQELWRRIVFGILVKNTDDHLRNHGFLLGPGGWRLSPLFDVNPTPWGTALALNITESSNLLDLVLALEVAPHFRIVPPDADRFIATCRKVLSTWKSMAQERGLPRSEIALMARALQEK